MRNSIQLSPETEAKGEAARHALGLLRKTFEQWTVIGAAIVAFRERANEIGGRKTFHRILEQQGLGAFVRSKAITSRLEKIMARLPEVMDWHRKLSPKEQIEWSSPGSVINHCPVFAKNGQPKPKPQPAVAKPQNLAKVMEQQEARIEELEQELEAAKSGRDGAPQTLDQLWDAVIERLQDEPQAKMIAEMKRLNKRLAEAWTERHPGDASKPVAKKKRPAKLPNKFVLRL